MRDSPQCNTSCYYNSSKPESARLFRSSVPSTHIHSVALRLFNNRMSHQHSPVFSLRADLIPSRSSSLALHQSCILTSTVFEFRSHRYASSILRKPFPHSFRLAFATQSLASHLIFHVPTQSSTAGCVLSPDSLFQALNSSTLLPSREPRSTMFPSQSSHITAHATALSDRFGLQSSCRGFSFPPRI